MRIINNAWKCHNLLKQEDGLIYPCAKIGSSDEFFVPRLSIYICPDCGSQNISPYKMFKCRRCNFEIPEEIISPNTSISDSNLPSWTNDLVCPNCELDSTSTFYPIFEEVPVKVL